jgi:ornithine--oxo-acid transaminase
MAAISMSCDNEATRGFGPALGGQLKVDFGDANALATLLEGKRGYVSFIASILYLFPTFLRT